MINLLVINQFASTPENLYGPGERMYHLAPYLSKSYEIEVVSGSYNHLFKYPPKVKKTFQRDNLTFLKFTWVKLRHYKKESFLGRALSWVEFGVKLFWLKLEKVPDIVVVSSMSLLPIFYAIWLKRRYKTKFILEIRDIWPLTPIELGGYSKYNPLIFLLRKVEILGYKNADHIVSVLPGFGRYLSLNGFSHKPFTWIPNGTVFSDRNVTRSDDNLFDHSKFNLVYAGTLGKANALDSLIECAKLLTDHGYIHFNFIGSGPYETQLKEKAKGCQNISFHPMVLKKDLPAILEKADVGYIGWHDKKIYEFGVAANKYNDYMLVGLPIISSSSFTDDPVVLGNAGIQVPADDPKQLAEAILEMYSSPEKRREFGDNGKKYVQSNHSYNVLSDKYLAVLEEVHSI